LWSLLEGEPGDVHYGLDRRLAERFEEERPQSVDPQAARSISKCGGGRRRLGEEVHAKQLLLLNRTVDASRAGDRAGAQAPTARPSLAIHNPESRYKMFCATVLYPDHEGSTFDFEYYAKTLAPMYAEFLGDNCTRYEVRKGLMTPGAPRAAFAIIASYWVQSDKVYQDSLSDLQFPEIMTKFAAFTDVEPIRQFDEVLSGDS